MREVQIARMIKWMGAVVTVLVVSSCLGGSEDSYEVEVPQDCQIAVLTLSHDTIAALGAAKFSIDQVKREIFNIDSLPCGTELEGVKVACVIQTVNSYAVTQVQVVPEATGDTISLKSTTESTAVKWTAEDSVDFSQPVEIIVTGIAGVTPRQYKAWVNIHQQEPEALVRSLWEGKYTRLKGWTKYKGGYYRVPEGGGGLRVLIDGVGGGSVSGGGKWLYLLGSGGGEGGKPAFLAGIARREEGEVFAWFNGEEFKEGGAVPDTFPRTGFGKVNYTAGRTSYLLLAGGRISDDKLSSYCWGTEDGENWAILTDARRGSGFTAREGSVVVKYDNKLWLFGGQGEDGVLDDLYISYDRGLNWESPPSQVRSSPSYVTPPPFSWVDYPEEADGAYFLLFDGSDVWRVGINRLL
jgi:hypothetical protein